MKRLFSIITLLTAVLLTAQAANIKLSTGATLDLHPADAAKANGRAIIICPGGGYSYLAQPGEGTDWIPFYNDLGYTVGVLSYRMPGGKHDVPLADGQAALKYIRDNAESLNVDPKLVGVMGFSAGGHLASTIATHLKGDEAPAFQVLFYPVITMQAGKTHQGSIDNLLGTNPSSELVELYSNEKQVDALTPPAFITYSENDNTVVPATNGLAYYNALVAAGVPAKMQSYASGGHGWGFSNAKFAWHAQLHQLLIEWLESLDDILGTERYTDVLTYTVPADAESITEARIAFLYPNLDTVVVNSPVVAATKYKEKANLLQYFGNHPSTYVFGEDVTAIGQYILTGADGVKRVKLPASVQTIGMQAFNKTSLEEVNFPEGLTEIGSYAFGNTALREVMLPEGLTTLGASAFRNCAQLESITFPASLTSLANYTLSGCPALTSIKFMSGTPATVANYFTDSKLLPNITIYVPAGSKALYEQVALWQKAKAIVEYDGGTGIAAAPAATAETATAYTLDGRRAAASQRGIVVVDGRKVMR